MTMKKMSTRLGQAITGACLWAVLLRGPEPRPKLDALPAVVVRAPKDLGMGGGVSGCGE